MQKQTKETLLVELTKVRQSHQEWVEGDERRRKEFAKAFGWVIQNSGFYSSRSETPTWPEIFVEVGRLLNDHESRVLTKHNEELKSRIEYLEKKLGDNPQ